MTRRDGGDIHGGGQLFLWLLLRLRWSIMSTADTSGSHELIVGPDGSIPADQIARLGFRAGSHLRVVTEPGDEGYRARGSLAGVLLERIDDAALDRFDSALGANRRERIAAIEQA